MVKTKIVYTTDGVITICSECGEEIKSILHKCNPFKQGGKTVGFACSLKTGIK